MRYGEVECDVCKAVLDENNALVRHVSKDGSTSNFIE
jgi:hypothetical protein